MTKPQFMMVFIVIVSANIVKHADGLFSRRFKQISGFSPTDFRRQAAR